MSNIALRIWDWRGKFSIPYFGGSNRTPTDLQTAQILRIELQTAKSFEMTSYILISANKLT